MFLKNKYLGYYTCLIHTQLPADEIGHTFSEYEDKVQMPESSLMSSMLF